MLGDLQLLALQEHPIGLSVLFRGLFWGEFAGD